MFVVETCQNCKEHHWNTRHDETKYEDFYHKSKNYNKWLTVISVAGAIIQRLPNAVVLRNQIPKSYLPYDLYVNLIPNEDENCPVYDQVPRTGSFEVSYKGMVSIFKRYYQWHIYLIVDFFKTAKRILAQYLTCSWKVLWFSPWWRRQQVFIKVHGR